MPPVRRPRYPLAVGILTGIGMAVWLLSSPPAIQPPPVTRSAKMLAESSNAFGFSLLAEAAKGTPEKNIFLSPLSVSTALAMTYNGAAGETERAMARTLGFQGMRLEQVNGGYRNLLDSLNRPGMGITLSVANRLWVRDGFTVKPDFLQRNRQFFSAPVAQEELGDPQAREIINRWVSGQTRGRISHLMEKGDIKPVTVLVLVNAAYLRGLWAEPFEKSHTQPGIFTRSDGTRVEGPIMAEKDDYDCLRGAGFQAVRLPYRGGRFAATVFLPDEGVPLQDMQQRLARQPWGRLRAAFSEHEVTVRLPVFRLEYGLELEKPLSALGMSVAFTGGANFSGIGDADGLFIGTARHKSFLEVDEKGTEAAAATSIPMDSEEAEPLIFSANRPFLLAIEDGHTGTLLFLGRIMDPSETPLPGREWRKLPKAAKP